MSAERFISKRLHYKGGIALIASAISFFVIIIAVAIAAGFRSEIRSTLSSINGDISLAYRPSDILSIDDPITNGDSLIIALSTIEGVSSAQAAIYRSAIVQSPEGIQGAIFKGISFRDNKDLSPAKQTKHGNPRQPSPTQPQAKPSDTHNPRKPSGTQHISNLQSKQTDISNPIQTFANSESSPTQHSGNPQYSENPELPFISIPSTLASKLLVQQGDTLKAHFIGELVESEEFIVDEIYEDILGAQDKQIIFTDIKTLQNINNWESDQYSTIELTLNDNARENIEQISQDLLFSTGLAVTPITKSYSQLFDWLNLIDYNVLAILALMIIVAGFNMISGLLILLFRNISTIGILKSLGMNKRSIAIVFIRVAARLAGVGMLIGNAAAMLFCLLQSATHLIKLDPANYFVSFVPVRLNIPQILFADAIAFCLIIVLMLLPTLFISSVDPSRTVTQE